MKLSVVIITFNEERNIRACLESVRQIADEIVVLDSFSTDNTEAICKEYDLHFEKKKFEGYIEQKNAVAELANFDYILSIDADEVLSLKLISEIRIIKEKPAFNAYSFNRLTHFCGKPIRHCGWYPDTKIRLWKRGTAFWGGKNPHDTLIINNTTPIKHLKGDLLHYSFHSIEQHVAQVNKFSSIKAEIAEQEGKSASVIHLTIHPAFKFFRCYVLKLGFLDGFYGYIVCKNSAHSTFLKYAKLREKSKT